MFTKQKGKGGRKGEEDCAVRAAEMGCVLLTARLSEKNWVKTGQLSERLGLLRETASQQGPECPWAQLCLKGSF